MRRVAIESALRRFGRGLPLVELLMAGEVAVLAGRHVARLDRDQRRRLLALLRKARGRPNRLDEAERDELRDLIAILEPRLFAGSAVAKLSPLPLPKRLLFGRRGSPARVALAQPANGAVSGTAAPSPGRADGPAAR